MSEGRASEGQAYRRRSFLRLAALVARRDYLRTVRRRGFIVGTAVLPLAIAGLLGLSMLFAPGVGEQVAAPPELAVVNEAHRAVEDGVADAAAIDRALRLGAGHPEGPFERWAGRGGAAAVLARLGGVAEAGPRFVPARSLIEGSEPHISS